MEPAPLNEDLIDEFIEKITDIFNENEINHAEGAMILLGMLRNIALAHGEVYEDYLHMIKVLSEDFKDDWPIG